MSKHDQEHSHTKKHKHKHKVRRTSWLKRILLAPFSFVFGLVRSIVNHLHSLFFYCFRRNIHFFDIPEYDNQNIYPTFKALNTTPSKAYVFLYFTLIIMLSLFFIWAAFFEIDAYVHSKGEVETFSKINTIISPESNIIEKIHVVEGQTVKKDELLITFDKTTQQANSTSIEKQFFSNQANIERLEAQLNDKDLVLTEAIQKYSEQIVTDTMHRFSNEISAYKDSLSILDQKYTQKNSEIKKIKDQIASYQDKYKIISDEVITLKKLAEQQLVTKSRLIEVEKELADNKIMLDNLSSDLPKAESELKEIETTKSQAINNYKKQLNSELDQARVLKNQLNAEYANVSTKLQRSTVLSPIDGIVYKIPNTTLSSSIQAGQEIISLVPIEDSLIVAANVRPEDIGLIKIGQEASVKITAYDYAIYGMLKGKVTQISPETIVNQSDNKPYFLVKIKTDKNYLSHHEKKFYISPGMVANTDIMVDKRTVLQYITNPFIKTVRESLSEK